MHSSKIILKLFKKEKRGSLKTWKHILSVTKSTLRPISSGVVLSGVALSQGRSIQGGILIAITITCDFLGRGGGGGSGLRGVHSSKIILKLFKKEKRGSLKTWKHILSVTKSTLRPISSGVVLSGVALSLNNCVLRCVLRVFVGVFEKLVLFCGPERGEERIILLVLARITILAFRWHSS